MGGSNNACKTNTAQMWSVPTGHPQPMFDESSSTQGQGVEHI